MPLHHVGVILTHVDQLGQLDDCLTRARLNTLKVVTAWGVAGGWTTASREWAARVPTLIVRTVAGDPSYARSPGPSPFPMPEAKLIAAEIAPWYAVRPNIWVELGNEPDVDSPDDDFIWRYRFYLGQTVSTLHTIFPQAKLIAPGLMGGPRADRFADVAGDVFGMCDAMAVHAYEYYSFTARNVARTKALENNLARTRRYSQGKPLWLTEVGINDTKVTTPKDKGQRYLRLMETCKADVIGATYYHLTTKPIDQDQAAYASTDELERELGKRKW